MTGWRFLSHALTDKLLTLLDLLDLLDLLGARAPENV